MADPEDTTEDPLFAALRPRRRPRSPIVGLLVMALAGWLLWQTREEVAYFFAPTAPAELGAAPAALASGKLRPNAYVRVGGTPDRKRSIVVAGTWGSLRAFFPLMRTQRHLWVAQPRKDRAPSTEAADSFAGRLVRFREQSFHGQIAAYYAENMTQTFDLDAKEVARAAGSAPGRLRDRDGVEVQVPAERAVYVGVAFPDDYRVQFDRVRHGKKEEAEAALAALGLPFAPLEESRAFVTYVVRAEGDAAARLFERFGDPSEKIGVVPRFETFAVRWRDVGAGAGGASLLLRALQGAPPPVFAPAQGKLAAAAPAMPLEVPLARVRSIEVSTQYLIPDNAWIVLERDAPRTHGWWIALDALLVAVIAGNLIVFGIRLRRRKKAAA